MVRCLLLAALLHAAPNLASAGKNTQSTATEYKYGGVDILGEHLGVLPTGTGVDMTRPNQAYCDGCLTAVEEFHVQWLQYVSKESREGDEVDQKGGGSAPPAITYNDEVEDAVSDVCKSKAFRASKHNDQITEVCQSMIGTEEIKRKVVASFLAKDLNAKLLPGRKKNLCEDGGLVSACEKDDKFAFDGGNSTKCGLCESVVQAALFEVRRKTHGHGAWTAKSVFEITDPLCAFGVLRHGEERVDLVYDLCDQMQDEHGSDIVSSIIKHYGDETAVVSEVCGAMTGHCAEGGGDAPTQKKSKGKKKKKKKAKADL